MNNYHDYVIKNGQYIGKFNEMYKACDDPWGQSEDGYFNDASRQEIVNFINKYKN